MIISLFKEAAVTGFYMLKYKKTLEIYNALGNKSTEEIIQKIEKANISTLNQNVSKSLDAATCFIPLTILEKTLRKGNKDILNSLLEKGVDVNNTYSFQHVIFRSDNYKEVHLMLDLMLEKKVNLNW
jgi:hypothetical protein